MVIVDYDALVVRTFTPVQFLRTTDMVKLCRSHSSLLSIPDIDLDSEIYLEGITPKGQQSPSGTEK
jgi:hypothetical protein